MHNAIEVDACMHTERTRDEWPLLKEKRTALTTVLRTTVWHMCWQWQQTICMRPKWPSFRTCNIYIYLSIFVWHPEANAQLRAMNEIVHVFSVWHSQTFISMASFVYNNHYRTIHNFYFLLSFSIASLTIIEKLLVHGVVLCTKCIRYLTMMQLNYVFLDWMKNKKWQDSRKMIA